MGEKVRKIIPLLILLVLTIPAFMPVLAPGFFPMHDNTQPSRVFEMAKALMDGMFPVRWSADLGFGYGYPLFNYYAPLVYYVGATFNLAGFNALDATKILLALGFILSALAMYIFAKEFLGKLGGIIAALFYVYAPYHAVNIYVRGAVSEFWAYGFIPLAFWGLYKIHQTEKFKYVAFTALFFALIVLSHNLAAFITAPFLLLYSFFLFFKKRNIKLFYSVGIGLLLSAFYWVPALIEIPFFNVMSQIGPEKDIRFHFVCLQQLWTSQWGFGGSIPGCVDGMSYMIGKYHILAAILAVMVALLEYKNKKVEKGIFQNIVLFFAFGVLSIFLMTSYSQFIWELVSPMRFIQFPWRFLLITSFTFSFVAGSLFYLFRKRLNSFSYIILALIVSIAIVFLYSKFFVPQEANSKNASDYVSKNALNYNISKISHEFMPSNFKIPGNINEVSNLNNIEDESIVVVNSKKRTGRIELNLRVEKETKAVIPIAYFPAWKAYVNGEEVPVEKNPRGIKVKLPEGKVMLEFLFRETLLEKFANVLSLAGVLILAYGIIRKPK
ncbi:MAG: hypothetical protein A2798_01845 [Candidatus Levybacteria bacterium RIFCSPHIGHO2_01_FULL_37_17]|nr:MAG: hypothetical protein A2798_01845 [Candidatus Levybacteria bacterium RIFCSPHIGHO2_01_FULL_37_17]OGH37190.1 MAG: hypothetical protein A2959_02705 [Candidatus Levybacteria bacterium RIFCSPLOWO2_01_FULL_38_23]